MSWRDTGEHRQGPVVFMPTVSSASYSSALFAIFIFKEVVIMGRADLGNGVGERVRRKRI
jgi:hypothetical protein